MIVDAHAHVFERIHGHLAQGEVIGIGYGRVRVGMNEIIQVLPPLCEATRLTPEMLLRNMDLAGVERTVLLQGNFYGEMNDYVAGVVNGWPDRFTGAAYLDPWEGDPHAVFTHCVEDLGLRIMKIPVDDAFGLGSIHPGARLDDECVTWLWPEMERRGLIVTLDLGGVGSSSYQTDLVECIARNHPGLKIVIAHLGQPTVHVDKDPRLIALWEKQVLLGLLPNVWFDLSALPAKTQEEPYPYPSSGRWIRRAIELVGPKKLMWGTDVPGLLTSGTYTQLLTQMDVHLEGLGHEDLAAILGQTAMEVYGIVSRRLP
jgi:predicted TIM-barrel fold metal-dependent hydrolase